MNTKRLLNYLFSAYMAVVLMLILLGLGSVDVIPDEFEPSVNLGLLIALIVLLLARFFVDPSEV